MDPTTSPKVRQRKDRELGVFPNSQHFASKGACWSSGMGLGRMISNQSFTWTCTNQTTSWLMHSKNTFGARMSHRQTRTPKTHHGVDLGEATTFPLIVYSMSSHMTNTQMPFCPKIPKWESWNSQRLGFLQFWGPITLCADLQLRWGLKRSCSPCSNLSNGISHATCMQENRGDSLLLAV
jgi:hypothetical protein